MHRLCLCYYRVYFTLVSFVEIQNSQNFIIPELMMRGARMKEKLLTTELVAHALITAGYVLLCFHVLGYL